LQEKQAEHLLLLSNQTQASKAAQKTAKDIAAIRKQIQEEETKAEEIKAKTAKVQVRTGQ
jgi:hypothetical protein